MKNSKKKVKKMGKLCFKKMRKEEENQKKKIKKWTKK